MIMCELRYFGRLVAKHKRPSVLLKIKHQLEEAYPTERFTMTFYNYDRLNYTE